MAVKTNYVKKGKNGKEYHYYRLSVTLPDGKEKEFTGKSKKEAEAKRDRYLDGIKAGLAMDYDKVTLKNLMHQWLFEVLLMSDKVKPATFDRYEGLYRNYVRDSELGGLAVSGIKSIQIQRYYNGLYENEKPTSTIKNIHKVLRYFFNYAYSADFVLKNPCRKVNIPGDATEIEDEEIDPFSDEEVKRIIANLNEHIEMQFLLSLGTGLRVGELLALTKKDIDLKNKVVKINKNLKKIKDIKKDGSYKYKMIVQPPKTKRSKREVPIPSKLIAPLQKYILNQKKKYFANGLPFTDDNVLFTTKSCKYIDAGNQLKTFKRVLRRADVPYRKFHNVRHTYATKLFETEVPLVTVSRLLGHANIQITANTYTHVMPKIKEAAVDNLNYMFS